MERKEFSKEEAADAKERRRRWFSGIAFAILVFLVAYAVCATNVDHWGATFGWLPSSVIATASGWVGYRLPWIGDAIAFLIDVLTVLTLFG